MKKSIIALIIVAASLNVRGQQKLSLSDAIAMGLENNYDLQIIRKDEETAKANNTPGNAGALPSISFNMSGTESFYLMDDDDNYRKQNITPEVSLDWVLFDGFSVKMTKKKLNQLEEQSKGNTAVLVESTIEDIILAYNSCLLEKEKVDVYKKLSELSEDRYKREEDSKLMGASTTYESLQSKTSWLEDKSNYLQQKIDFDNAVRSLNYVLGVQDDISWEFTDELKINAGDYDLDDLKAKLLDNNQSLKNQYLNQSLLAKETALAKSAVYPSLSLNSGVARTRIDNYYKELSNTSSHYTDAYIGLSLSFNIFNGGITRRSVQLAKISEESEQVATDQMKHSLTNELLQQYSTYTVQKTVLELANEQEAAAKLNLEMSEEKYKTGAINSFNYRDVQNDYMDAAISKLEAVYNLIESNTELLRMTGGIITE